MSGRIFHLTKRRSQFIGFGIVILFFIGTGIVIQTRSVARYPATQTPSKTPVASQTEIPSSQSKVVILDNFHRSLSEDGRMAWEIKGTRGILHPDTGIASIDLPHLLLARQQDENIDLTSKRADLKINGNELLNAELFDDVVIIYKSETEIRTQKAIYDKTANSVSSPGPVVVTNKMMQIESNELYADLETKEFHFTTDVRTVIKPKKEIHEH